jgi:hypothetical protein
MRPSPLRGATKRGTFTSAGQSQLRDQATKAEPDLQAIAYHDCLYHRLIRIFLGTHFHETWCAERRMESQLKLGKGSLGKIIGRTDEKRAETLHSCRESCHPETPPGGRGAGFRGLRREGLRPAVFYRWQKEFFENGAAAFEATEGPSVDLARSGNWTSRNSPAAEPSRATEVDSAIQLSAS